MKRISDLGAMNCTNESVDVTFHLFKLDFEQNQIVVLTIYFYYLVYRLTLIGYIGSVPNISRKESNKLNNHHQSNVTQFKFGDNIHAL